MLPSDIQIESALIFQGSAAIGVKKPISLVISLIEERRRRFVPFSPYINTSLPIPLVDAIISDEIARTNENPNAIRKLYRPKPELVLDW
jgi:hypothetical protein